MALPLHPPDAYMALSPDQVARWPQSFEAAWNAESNIACAEHFLKHFLPGKLAASAHYPSSGTRVASCTMALFDIWTKLGGPAPKSLGFEELRALLWMGIGSRSTYFYPGVVGGEKPTSPFWRPGQGDRYLPMLLQRRAGTQ